MVTEPNRRAVARACACVIGEAFGRSLGPHGGSFSPLWRPSRPRRALASGRAIAPRPVMSARRTVSVAPAPVGPVFNGRSSSAALCHRWSDPFDGQAGQLLNSGQRAIVGRRDHHQSGSSSAGASGPADAMDIVLGVMRHVKIENVAHVRDVEAAGRHVAGDEQLHLVGTEALQRLHARALIHVAMQRRDAEAVSLQGAMDDSEIAFAIAEDDTVLDVFGVADDPAQRGALLLGLAAGSDKALQDRGGCRGGPRHLHLHGVVQKIVDETLNLRRHGRREKQRLSREWHEPADTLDVGNETHIEHAISLVDDEDLDAGKQELAALEMIEEAAGRGDQHVDATGDLDVLIAERNATNEQRDVELMVRPILDEALFDLRG